MGALAIFDREEGAQERLDGAGISAIALLTRTALRSYCSNVVRSESHAGERASQASRFLTATSRIRVRLITPQDQSGSVQDVVRIAAATRAGPSLLSFKPDMQLPDEVAQRRIADLYVLVSSAVTTGCRVLVLPELSMPLRSIPVIQRLSAASGLTIIAGMEYDERGFNCACIAIAGEVRLQAKLVRSPHDAAHLVLGEDLFVFQQTPIGDFAVLICADQFDYRLFAALRGRVDFVIVVARNRAVNTSASTAGGDSYRMFCYIVYVNDGASGDSYLASPSKGPEKLTWLSRDDADVIVPVCLNIGELRAGAPRLLKQISFSEED